MKYVLYLAIPLVIILSMTSCKIVNRKLKRRIQYPRFRKSIVHNSISLLQNIG